MLIRETENKFKTEKILLRVSFGSLTDIFTNCFSGVFSDVVKDVLQRVRELLGVLVGEAERRDEEDNVLVLPLHRRDDVLLTHPV